MSDVKYSLLGSLLRCFPNPDSDKQEWWLPIYFTSHLQFLPRIYRVIFERRSNRVIDESNPTSEVQSAWVQRMAERNLFMR